MNIAELEIRLREEGCTGYALRDRGSASDAFCIVRSRGEWTIFYTERGIDSPPVYTTPSESDACEFFLNRMIQQNNWHLVGFFTREQSAISLETQLRGLSVDPIRNDIPAFARANDPRFRVFVAGRQIHAVRDHFGVLPIKD